MNNHKISIKEIRLQPGDKVTKAFVDIALDDVTVRDFRVCQHNGGRPYVRAPFTSYRNRQGEVSFNQIVDLPEEVKGQVDTLILSVFYREQEQANAEKRK